MPLPQLPVGAGWYPDHASPGHVRYFDGTAWTAHTAPAVAPGLGVQVLPQQFPAQRSMPHPGAGTDPTLRWILPIGRSWQAIAAGYVALFATVLWFLGPIAIWLGVAALRAAEARDVGGRGRARFAIIVGVPATLAMLIYLVTRI